MMKTLFHRWWIPVLSHMTAFIVFVVGLPYFFHKIHFLHRLTLGFIEFNAVCFLLLLARIHKFSLKFTISWIIFIGFLIWFSWPQVQLGHWPSQLALHLLIWSFLAYLVSGSTQAIMLYKIKNKK